MRPAATAEAAVARTFQNLALLADLTVVDDLPYAPLGLPALKYNFASDAQAFVFAPRTRDMEEAMIDPPTHALPRDDIHDYTHALAEARRRTVLEATDVGLEHVGSYSFDPEMSEATSKASAAWLRCRSASPVHCWSTVSTPTATISCRWPPPRARWWRATAAGCDSPERPVESEPP